MNIDTIIEKIHQDAAADAASATASANAKAASSAAAIAAEANHKIAEIEKNAKNEIAEVYRRRQLIAELEGRKSALAKKREVLDEAFALALLELCAMSGDKWESLITRIVLESVQTGTEKLRVPAKDLPKYKSGVYEKLDAAFSHKGALLDKLNTALVATGKKGALTLDDTAAPFENGIVLIGKTTEVNGSFEALLRDAREYCEREIAQLLFSATEGQ